MQSAVTKGSLWLPFVVFAALAAAGCATGADEAVQQDLARMRKDLDTLNLAVHRSRGETETVLSQLERRTREQSGESTRQLAAMNARIDGLTAEMNRLAVRLDELCTSVAHNDVAAGVAPQNHGLDAGQRTAHRAGLDIHARVVGDHDSAGFGLPPVVVNRQPERVLTPHDGLGIERLAHARHEAQAREIVLAYRLESDLHQHAHGRGRRVPDGDLLLLDDPVPAVRIEVALVDDAGDAVREG